MAGVRKSARLSAASEKASAINGLTAPMPPPPPQRTRSKPAASRKRKVAVEEEHGHGETPVAPRTPPRRRAAAVASSSAPPPPPATPTPSAVSLISEAGGSSTATSRRRQQHPALTRVADPLATNAQLLSPETSRIVVSRRPPVEDVSPTKKKTAAEATNDVAVATPKTITTTATLLEEACAHLIKVDPRMKPLVEAHHCRIFSPEGLAEQLDPFESLCSGIISQQVSGAAARSIKSKFVALFTPESGGGDGGAAKEEDEEIMPNGGDGQSKPARFPHPSQVAVTTIERLRTAGLSQRKAEYVRGLAEKFVSGELSASVLADAPYDEVISRLTAVRGLGLWSAEMFACFGLKRMDVFSLGDLGVQRGMAAFVGRDVGKLKAAGKGGKWKYMSEAEMREISDRFKPFRSLFMWYMWRVEETDISTME